MPRPSTVFLAVRAALVLLIAFGFVLFGILLDGVAETSPLGTLSMLVVGITFGTIMLLVVIVSSFPKPPTTGGKTGKTLSGD